MSVNYPRVTRVLIGVILIAAAAALAGLWDNLPAQEWWRLVFAAAGLMAVGARLPRN